jgi:hypothetical protein
MESEGKKACKIEQTCHTDLHMLLENKLNKKFHYKKQTFVKHFSQIQKESFEICKVHHANRAIKVRSTRANHCVSNWFQKLSQLQL